MKKLSKNAKEIMGVILFLSSILILLLTAILFQKYALTWLAAVGPTISSVLFVLAIIIMPKSEKIPQNKPKKHKPKRIKEPRLTYKEWQDDDEEDDEMMFINEIVDDD